MAGGAQAMPELDVLDRRSWKARGVESADVGKYGPSDRAAAAPECRGLGVARLVSVVVQEITILRDQPRSPWAAIVRAKHRGEVGVGLERLHDAADRIGCDYDISVDEQHDGTASGASTGVARGRRSAVPGEAEDDGTELRG